MTHDSSPVVAIDTLRALVSKESWDYLTSENKIGRKTKGFQVLQIQRYLDSYELALVLAIVGRPQVGHLVLEGWVSFEPPGSGLTDFTFYCDEQGLDGLKPLEEQRNFCVKEWLKVPEVVL